MRTILMLALVWPATVAAQSFEPMTGAEIAAALTDKTFAYDGATQRFYASGRTLYQGGRDEWGYWRVDGNQYCSQWPPDESWSCFDMLKSGGTIRFVSQSGATTDGARVR